MHTRNHTYHTQSRLARRMAQVTEQCCWWTAFVTEHPMTLFHPKCFFNFWRVPSHSWIPSPNSWTSCHSSMASHAWVRFFLACDGLNVLLNIRPQFMFDSERLTLGMKQHFFMTVHPPCDLLKSWILEHHAPSLSHHPQSPRIQQPFHAISYPSKTFRNPINFINPNSPNAVWRVSSPVCTFTGAA